MKHWIPETGPQTGPAADGPEREPDLALAPVPEPVPEPGLYAIVKRACLVCGTEVEMWATAGDESPVPRHLVRARAEGVVTLRGECWAGGWDWGSVRAMADMRAENGGALLRAAHP